MSSAYATAPVIFSDHPLAAEIPNLAYNPFGLTGQLAGSGPRWTDGIWMLHGKTKLDIIAVLADIGNVVWSNSDYKYPIVSANAVHKKSGVDGFTTTLCKDLNFTNDRTRAWITGEYGFVDSFPETGWDCIIYLSGPKLERDSWQKRCMLEYILTDMIEGFELVGHFVEQNGKIGIAVKSSNEWTQRTKEILKEACNLILMSNFKVYESTSQDDWNSINWRTSEEFEIEIVKEDEGEERRKAEERRSGRALGVKSVAVSGGRFMMGALPSDGKAAANEKPRHEVKISSDMVVMKYPVTQKVYEGVMSSNPSGFKGGERPVEKVSWFDAVKFANALSLKCGLSEAYRINGDNVSCDWNSNGWRLPTEAEWEYLARGGEEHLYSGSDDIDSVAWYAKNRPKPPHPVGMKAANGFGLYDMTGNVWEWCWDWWKRDYSIGSVIDPRGPSSGSNRVLRGGGWNNNAWNARASYRSYSDLSDSLNNIGFRLLRRKN